MRLAAIIVQHRRLACKSSLEFIYTELSAKVDAATKVVVQKDEPATNAKIAVTMNARPKMAGDVPRVTKISLPMIREIGKWKETHADHDGQILL